MISDTVLFKVTVLDLFLPTIQIQIQKKKLERFYGTNNSTYIRLTDVAVTSLVVRSVWDKLRIVSFHKAERSVVDGDTKYTHVVCVQNPMSEANTLPSDHHV